MPKLAVANGRIMFVHPLPMSVPNDMKKQNRAVESSTATQNSSDAAPTILNGEPIPPLQLPEGFDFTYHLKVVAAGKVRPASHEDFQRLIAELKSSKKIGSV